VNRSKLAKLLVLMISYKSSKTELNNETDQNDYDPELITRVDVR
jgi:hypothetical protein